MKRLNIKYRVSTIEPFDMYDIATGNKSIEDFIVNTTAFTHATVDLICGFDDLDIRHQAIKDALGWQINLSENEIIRDFYVVL